MFQSVFISCAADNEEQSRRRIDRVVNTLLERHRAMLDMLLKPAQERIAGDKRRLELLLSAAKSARTPQERTRAAIEIAETRQRLATGSHFRKIDRATYVEPPGIVVTRKQLTAFTIAATTILSLAFGVFVSVSFAAASMLRRGGGPNGSLS